MEKYTANPADSLWKDGRDLLLRRTTHSSLDPAARRDHPRCFDAIVANDRDAVVKIHGCADMVGDDRDPIADLKSPRGLLEMQHPMLLPEARHPRGRIGREVPKAASRLP